jgi:hypothetical protein
LRMSVKVCLRLRGGVVERVDGLRSITLGGGGWVALGVSAASHRLLESKLRAGISLLG